MKIKKDFLLLFITLLFSFALMFAFIELPRLLDSFVQSTLGFPQFDQGQTAFNTYRGELFIDAFYLRWIGYGSLTLVAILVVAGYATRQTGWAWAGAIAMFLPVFGQFAMSMFFLAGLGILRVGWLPFMDISIKLLEMGNIILIPYWILMWIFRQFGYYAHNFLAYFFMTTGSVIFGLSVFTWFKTRQSDQVIAVNWLYRFSRHPQYMGWIIWSYGLMLYSEPLNDMKKSWITPASLPWLLTMMIILGICLLEELRMKEISGDAYERYRRRAPFLFPLPRWFKSVLLYPMRIFIRTDWPSSRGQAAGVVMLYSTIFILFSLFFIEFNNTGTTEPNTVKIESASRHIDSLCNDLPLVDNRGHSYNNINHIRQFGDKSIPAFIKLLEHKNEHVREFSADALHDLKPLAATDPLIKLLQDSVYRVQRAAVRALGNIGEPGAADSIIKLVDKPLNSGMKYQVYSALGNIKSKKAWPALVKGSLDTTWFVQNAARNALYKTDRDSGLIFILEGLHSPMEQVRRQMVMILLEDPHPGAIDGLKEVLDDPDFETRFYARQVLKILAAEDTKLPN